MAVRFLLLIEFSTFFFTLLSIHEKESVLLFAKSNGIGAKTKRSIQFSGTNLSLGLLLESKIFAFANEQPVDRAIKMKDFKETGRKIYSFISGAIKAYATYCSINTVMNYYFLNFSGFFLIGCWRRKKTVTHNEKRVEFMVRLFISFEFSIKNPLFCERNRRIDHDGKENMTRSLFMETEIAATYHPIWTMRNWFASFDFKFTRIDFGSHWFQRWTICSINNQHFIDRQSPRGMICCWRSICMCFQIMCSI